MNQILHDHLGVWKHCAHRVPHNLTEEQRRGSKQQLAVWVFPGEAPPLKYKRSKSVAKQMVACFFSKSGHVATIPLEGRKTSTPIGVSTTACPRSSRTGRRSTPIGVSTTACARSSRAGRRSTPIGVSTTACPKSSRTGRRQLRLVDQPLPVQGLRGQKDGPLRLVYQPLPAQGLRRQAVHSDWYINHCLPKVFKDVLSLNELNYYYF